MRDVSGCLISYQNLPFRVLIISHAGLGRVRRQSDRLRPLLIPRPELNPSSI